MYGRNWALLLVDPNLLRYYRNLYWLTTYKCRRLNPGKRESHITLVAGTYESPVNPQKWGAYEGDAVEFQYDSPENSDGMYWLPVVCPRLQAIREELGLRPNLKFPFHITFGYLHE